MNKPHKHAELIKAWADGAKIEFLPSGSSVWGPWPRGWDWDGNYRIKPKPPKPDVVSYDGKKAAQPAQEPVAWMYQCTVDNSEPVLLRKKQNWAESSTGLWVETPLSTTPPQRPWVGLTEEDFSAINQSCFTKLQAATSAESILKAKNT